MADTISWGILGTGKIAAKFANAIKESRTGRLAAVGSRAQDSADRFGTQHAVPHRHGSYEALLSDPAVEVVYIATPHPMHAPWCVKAAEAGKHILCEKPLGLNHAQAAAAVSAAREHDVFLMEALMYRCHPQTARILELIRGGAVGEVRLVQAAFGFQGPYDLQNRILNRALGGGGILDVGGYPVSMARLIAGAAAGVDFAEPVALHACAHLGAESGVDEYAIAGLKFPGDVLAQCGCGVRLNQENVARIFGTEGQILVPEPWQPGRAGGPITIILQRGGERQEILVAAERGFWAIEVDTVAAHIEQRQAAPPSMTWADSLGNMKALDMWRAAIGLRYEGDA
ncbi:MAG: Gfo/Idh/MocA family oxidoreductase [Kiritimatiellae bacterium]|nr:Gfo/Idh/MocA family oxidoreductase [Kiritimatiellia bacterium]